MFSVHINKRPIKIAFLINPNHYNWQEWIDAIWEYNQEKWGGRYNPIIPTDGKTIDEKWWHFLGELDPDYVFSVFQIQDELKNEIEKRICPIKIEFPRNLNDTSLKPNINLDYEGLSALPNSTNIGKFATLLSHNILASFRGIDWTVEKDVFRFLLRSFGIFQDIYHINKTLEKVDKKVSFQVNDKTKLIQILNELTKPAVDFVYPIQYSTLGKQNWWIELENEHSSYDVFGIIVGDTFEEQLFLRNKVFYERDFGHTRLSHIWLPKSFVEDLDFMEALGNWLRRKTSEVHLFSFSISKEELARIGENLDFTKEPVGLRQSLYKSVTSYKEFPFPKYQRDYEFSFWDRISHPINLPRNCDFYRANSLEESLEIKSPSQSENISENGYWMAEVFIEADKNRFYNQKYYSSPKQSFWWRLPRKNYLARDIFKQKARINSNGLPLVLLSGKTPILNFKLPDEIGLLNSCILGDWKGKMAGEVKRKGLEIHYAQPSNIGKYLSGFLGMFGGLALAHSYLKERYWRNMFDILSGRDLKKDLGIKNEVRNKLSKKIRKNLTSIEMIKNFEDLADFVIRLSENVTFDGKMLEYRRFVDEAKTEHEEFQKEDTERVDWKFNENALKRSISELLELGVIQMGFSQKCPRCGSKNWYLIDNATQYLNCDGCRYGFSMPANPEISYKLSSLVRLGIFAHGLVPVILVLGQLLEDSHSSFFFAPSMDLYKRIPVDPLDYEKLTDSDIVCIKDGNLIIGEIKQSQKQFTERQMMDLADVAESIEADVLLLSSLDEKPNQTTNELIEKVKEKLKDSKIQVGWYQLDEVIFEPSRGDC